MSTEQKQRHKEQTGKQLFFVRIERRRDEAPDLIDDDRHACHHGSDEQQGQRNAKHIFGHRTLFHFFAASFRGAPYRVGRPIRSSSTTQAFITRMA